MKQKRYTLPDTFRGLILLSMITYHTLWDMVYIFGEKIDCMESDLGYLWQQSICWSFILLSGFCWSFGKRKWKRGIQVFAAGLLVSLITILVVPRDRVLFGVLTMLGSCMLFMIPLEKVCRKINPYVGTVIAFLMFLYTKGICWGYLGWKEFGYVRLPQEWYSGLFSTYWGFKDPAFFSTDYFSIFPWFFLFLAGYFLYGIFEKNRWMNILNRGRITPLETLGKNSLLVYMVHQPLIYGVLMLVYEVLG